MSTHSRGHTTFLIVFMKSWNLQWICVVVSVWVTQNTWCHSTVPNRRHHSISHLTHHSFVSHSSLPDTEFCWRCRRCGRRCCRLWNFACICITISLPSATTTPLLLSTMLCSQQNYQMKLMTFSFSLLLPLVSFVSLVVVARRHRAHHNSQLARNVLTNETEIFLSQISYNPHATLSTAN